MSETTERTRLHFHYIDRICAEDANKFHADVERLEKERDELGAGYLELHSHRNAVAKEALSAKAQLAEARKEVVYLSGRVLELSAHARPEKHE